ncbi:MAG: isoleucine--tRNA ligase [Candidatus Lokiarchaeota archaeon]|nr:isoleucine--tRNA ligase [Candidatus Lokiarchaeota archaeon]
MKELPEFDSRAIEERILDWWEKEKIYKEIKKAEPKDKVWRFIDGPPYTTGNVHLGTAWNKILKDYLIRYKRMQGFRVTDTPGYDTHGLPIEVLMEQNLGIHNKKEIIDYGLEKFIDKCREHAESQIPKMNEQFKRLGCTFWNWENPYITLKNTYIQGIWWTLKEAYKNGLLYQFYKPQNCCPRCATALAKHEFEYHNVKDNAIFVKFQSVEDPKTFYLIWTTTPWTLVANTNIMANPNNEYVEMRVKDETWIMGIAATANLLQFKLELARGEEDGFDYGRRFKGTELEGKRYIHPLIDEVPYQKELEKQQPKVHTIVLSSEYVTEGEGVGLVHTAPGHGPEDFEVGMANNIPVFNPVDMHGKYTDEAGIFEGKFVHDTNEEIINILKQKNTLVYIDEIEHEYAHCWRCKSKLVYRATRQWFFKTTELNELMLKENEDIYWVPDWAGHTNFRLWLENLRDWCISRQRFWGIPLSIWTCQNEDCEHIRVIGSAQELKEVAGKCPEDLHRPHIDKVTWKCPKCGDIMKRIPDILDVWLDSGSVMWAAQKFVDGKEHYDTWVPADFILEGKDQIRGWFNSLLCSAIVSSKRKNYNSCYMHGWVQSHGTKMSKSLGNAIEPEDIIRGEVEILTEAQKEHLRKLAAEQSTSKFDKTKKKSKKKSKKSKKKSKKKYIKDNRRWSNVKGIETFRFFCVGGTQAGRDLNFDYKEYVDTFKVLNTFWNMYLFAEEKMNLNDFKPSEVTIDYKQLSLEDKWVLSATNTMIKHLTELFDKYYLPDIPALLQNYILNDLSRWYIRLIRNKIDPNMEDPGRFQSLKVLWTVLYQLVLVMAPVNPMLTEELYQKMFKDDLGKNVKKSVHLESWPDIKQKYVDEKLEKEMNFARKIIDSIRSLKMDHRIKLRWPTKALYIIPKEELDELRFIDIIQQKANVKEVKILDKMPKGKLIETEISECKLVLDLEDTKEIQQDRIIKDLLRTIQYLRKINDFNIEETITLQLATEHDFVFQALKDNEELIATKVSAEPLDLVNGKIEEDKSQIYHEFHLCLNESCYASVREKHAKKIKANKKKQCNYCKNQITKDSLGVIQIQFSKNEK